MEAIDENYTGQEICEAWVKYKGLDMTAQQFWEAGYGGELWHVYLALAEMKAAGIEIPRKPNPRG